MKICIKIFAVFISVLILLSSTGILLIHHYCTHCKTDDWRFFSSINCKSEIVLSKNIADNCKFCKSNPTEKKVSEKPCCSNEGLFFKIGTFYSNIEISIISDIDNFNIIACNYFYNDNIRINNDFSSIGKSPPKLYKQIFLINNYFRI